MKLSAKELLGCRYVAIFKFPITKKLRSGNFWLCVGEISVSKFTGTQGITLLGTDNHRDGNKIRPPSLPSKRPPNYHSINKPTIKGQISYSFFFDDLKRKMLYLH